MRDEFEKLVAAGKINHKHVEALVKLAETRYCHHRSWGFGCIKEVDTVFGRFHIDFPSKPGHSMDLAFAAESLKPIPTTHILARKATDLEGLRKLAVCDPVELIRLVLQSTGGKATLDQVQQVLVPEVIKSDWKKWWDVAKHTLKKDGHFQIPLKKTDLILYQAKEMSLVDRMMEEFRGAKGLKARILAGGELVRNLGDIPDKVTPVTEAVQKFNEEIVSHQKTMPAVALEGIFMRNDLRAAVGGEAIEGELSETDMWAQVDNLGRTLEQVTIGKHKRALESFKAARPEFWADQLLGIVNSVNSKLCGECANLLIENGKLGALKDTLMRLISQHAASSELLLWLARERSDTYADILGPEVFRAMLTAIERDQFNEKKSNRLRDFIMDDQELLVELIESADIEVIKDLTRALQLSPSFDDMDKRSLLARIVKHFPVVQSLISGEHTRQDSTLVVSWSSLERRKDEYNDLVQKKIPANSRDIAIARSYGDLRENHEYKAAKEAHRILMRRKAELESQLSRARGTDFANPRTDVVSIGTSVQATELTSQQVEQFVILGAWDFDPDQHIISYLTPVGQALLNRKPGEEVEVEVDGTVKKYRLESIAAWQTVPIAATSPAPANQEEGSQGGSTAPASQPD
jgi:transcription elongation GreA/GreB family factor